MQTHLSWPSGEEIFFKLEVVDCVEREHEKSDVPLAEFIAERFLRQAYVSGRPRCPCAVMLVGRISQTWAVDSATRTRLAAALLLEPALRKCGLDAVFLHRRLRPKVLFRGWRRALWLLRLRRWCLSIGWRWRG